MPLGAFDPLLLGWASRDPIVGPHRRIVTVNGLFRPFALAGGRAVATWNIAGGQVAFAPLGTQTRTALAADAADVMRFLGEQDPSAGRYDWSGPARGTSSPTSLWFCWLEFQAISNK